MAGNQWQWVACGKHPVAKDYFRIGSRAVLLEAIADWIDKGYQMLRDKKREASRLNSWRFWAKGPSKKMVVCGVTTDSSDSIGRPYPLLVAGTGVLNGWQKQWDLLPLAFEKTWDSLAYLSARRYVDFKQFEEEVTRLKPPQCSWPELVDQRSRRIEDAKTGEDFVRWDVSKIRSLTSKLAREPQLIVEIEPIQPEDPITPVCVWHSFMKERAKTIPNVIFTGGAENAQYLAIFNRALGPGDFLRLWSATDKSGS